VMLDRDLAEMYGVETRAVKRAASCGFYVPSGQLWNWKIGSHKL
jgi:hypothetical protein